MKTGDHVIAGIHVKNRTKNVSGIQKVLSAFGSCIRTRLGLHTTTERYSSKNGLIIVELVASEAKITKFCKALEALKGVDVQFMIFDHD